MREELDSCRAGICQHTARTFLKDQQVVGQQPVATLEEACRECRFSKRRMSQKRDGAPVCHDDGRVERLELLLHERNRQRLSQQVDLDHLLEQPVSWRQEIRRPSAVTRNSPMPSHAAYAEPSDMSACRYHESDSVKAALNGLKEGRRRRPQALDMAEGVVLVPPGD